MSAQLEKGSWKGSRPPSPAHNSTVGIMGTNSLGLSDLGKPFKHEHPRAHLRPASLHAAAEAAQKLGVLFSSEPACIELRQAPAARQKHLHEKRALARSFSWLFLSILLLSMLLLHLLPKPFPKFAWGTGRRCPLLLLLLKHWQELPRTCCAPEGDVKQQERERVGTHGFLPVLHLRHSEAWPTGMPWIALGSPLTRD